MSKHIHILGICGTFMGSLGVLAKQKGYKVTGSDINVYPPMSTYLESQGIEIIQGFDCSQLDTNPDEIVIGNVMTRGVPIIERILNQKLSYFSGPEWLYENILKYKKVIAVAGTHGKTTTTSMVIKIFDKAGLDPSFLVGGICDDFGISSRYTNSEYFIIEADEYDTAFFDKRSKFIHYDPSILVINNMEYDHADIFKNIEAIYWQFHQLIRKMPAKASIIYNASDTNVREILDMGYWSDTTKINSKQGFYISKHNADYSEFSIASDFYSDIKVSWNLIGQHNAFNAISAIAAAKQINISNEDIENALNIFKGVKRRLEVLYSSNSVILYDDFAHHPTSIKLAIEAIRNKTPNAYVVAIVDPRSNTMRQGNNKESLPAAVAGADKVLLYNHKLLKWDAEELFKDSDNVELMSFVDEFIKSMASVLNSNGSKITEIVMMGNGSFEGLREKLIEFLRGQE